MKSSWVLNYILAKVCNSGWFSIVICYFSLDRKVTKRSRLQRLGYSGKRLRSTSGTRFAQTAAALSASSFTFASRLPAEAVHKKAELSLRMADADTYITGGISHSKRKLRFLSPASTGEREAQRP
ncbi:hypothetical protein [Parabacteroides sp. AM08-6]|uniref:hypothetical protein n=1 Tax=Parabacteroides sp. AM08-6 TaxID=2292053 RepID=UPI001F3F708D|nr:hypothetical protein [Parabacteroides sp. AM08-6]